MKFWVRLQVSERDTSSTREEMQTKKPWQRENTSCEYRQCKKLISWKSGSDLFDAINDLIEIKEDEVKVFKYEEGSIGERDVEELRPEPEIITEYVD